MSRKEGRVCSIALICKRRERGRFLSDLWEEDSALEGVERITHIKLDKTEITWIQAVPLPHAVGNELTCIRRTHPDLQGTEERAEEIRLLAQ